MKKLISLFVFVAVLAGCSSVGKLIQEPKVQLANLRIENPDLKGATLVFGVQVENPNNVPLQVDEVVYDLTISGKSLTSGKLAEGARVGAKETAIIDVPIALKYNDVFNSLVQLFKTQKTPYHIKGSAKMGLFNLPFDKQGELVFDKGRLR